MPCARRCISPNGLAGSGSDAFGPGKNFDLELRLGAGAYICGEETSLLESLEGKRPLVRAKPPVPAVSGLFGKPTLINNVLTFAAIPYILDKGGAAYAGYGMGRSLGTLPIQLAGNILRGGLIELAFGVSLREIIEDFGGGTASGRPVRAVQLGGPLGAYLAEKDLDVPLDYEALAATRRDARAWRHRRVRRHCGHGAHGAFRLPFLRRGKLRQMHALPRRRDARRGNHRQDHRRAECREEYRADCATFAK